MKTSQLIVLGVAVAAAGGAGVIAKKLASTPPPVQKTVIAPAAPAAPQIELTEVLIASDDLPMGEPIEDQLRWQEWPTKALNEQFITKDKEPDAVTQLRGAIVKVAISSGEPIRKSRLVGYGNSFMSALLPAGKRAVATQISADTSAGGFILPNDYVDVIMTRRAQQQGSDGFVTETILKNIRVLAIDQTIQEDEEGRKVKVGETATLELTPQQAEIITVAQQMADRLTLSLRSVKDAQDMSGTEADYLLSGEGGKRGIVRIIKAGEVSEEAAKK